MDRDQESRTSIVVIEAGAGWPSWITEYQQRAPNASVVAQTASEPIEALRARALHRLEELKRGPGRLGVGILLSYHLFYVYRYGRRKPSVASIKRGVRGGR
jgi:hypothetical protein